jgi:hypothetical protein
LKQRLLCDSGGIILNSTFAVPNGTAGDEFPVEFQESAFGAVDKQRSRHLKHLLMFFLVQIGARLKNASRSLRAAANDKLIGE